MSRPRAASCALLLAAALLSGCAQATTNPASRVTDRAAGLNAQVKADGEATQYWFQYGKTTAYGTETPRRNGGSDTAAKSVTERINGLTADTTYHFKACATNPSGGTCGTDVTFRTGSPGLLPGFQETTAFSGLDSPTAVRFAPDGRVFVAEKAGRIKVFDGLGDTTPTTFANLTTQVNSHWDRGLLGLALDPDFPAEPFVYALYTHDAPIGGTAPTWNDTCPDPPGATTDGCVTSARLSRLTAQGNQAVGPEQVLIEDWCQQSQTHTIGDLRFGPDGALYVSGGDAASPDRVDWGQMGIPKNPCGDPPVGVGGSQAPPTSEGGALRSQDRRTPADPTTLDGTILRVDPESGDPLPSNPLPGSTDPEARRIIAYGLRNPFRFAFRPGTSEIWLGDVGWNSTEEINRIPNASDTAVENFGWPCYEGNARQSGYDAANLNICENLYSSGGVVPGILRYAHSAKVDPEESCPTGSSALSGMIFNPPGSTFPAEFDGALFFADYARGCIWVMPRGTNGVPSPSAVRWFRAGAVPAVDIQFGPGGDLFYADIRNARIRRIHYAVGNQAPKAVAVAGPTSGDVPLQVILDARGSSDPNGDALTYAWDADGDGAYDDSTKALQGWTYNAAGTYAVGLKVTDEHGDSATDTVAVTVGNTPPTATIATPSPGLTWKVGDLIGFIGSATDRQDGNLAPARLTWSLALQHCPSNCHTHQLLSFPNTNHGTFAAPDHEYFAYLELTLTATDSGGLTDTRTIRLDPKTVNLTMRSSPSGLKLVVGSKEQTTPFVCTVIQGSANTLSAVTPQTLAGKTYDFGSWSDGGVGTHTVTANTAGTYTATYNQR